MRSAKSTKTKGGLESPRLRSKRRPHLRTLDSIWDKGTRFFSYGKRFGDRFSLITILKNLNFLPQLTRFLRNSEVKILR